MNQNERNKYLASPQHGSGWVPIITQLDRDLAQLDPEYNILQIKEKFGGLRYYFATETEFGPTMDALVRWAELFSVFTCEECGGNSDVTTSGSGWIKTLCNSCRIES